jgi:stage II sporulation protein D
LAIRFDGNERRIWDALSLQTETADGLFLVRIPSQPERTYSGRLEIAPAAYGLQVTIVLPLREYLYGVVGSEMGGEPEALKAQAILSRTYALFNRGRHRREGFDFCDTTHCQHFTGRARATFPIRQSVDTTSSHVLASPGNLCGVFFHSTCGGRTNEAGDVYPCLRSIDDGDNCSASPHYRWQMKIPKEKWNLLMKAIAPGRTSEPLHFRIVHTAPGGWVGTVSIVFSDGSTLHLTGEAFHLALGRRLGWNVFKSANFTVAKEGDDWIFSGRGLGHGLGLCQWGAKRLAARGWSCERILRHYFPAAEVKPYSGPLY